MARQGQGKVVKIDATWPFCVTCHIGIHFDTSVGMDVINFINIQIASLTNGDQKWISIINLVAIEKN